MNKKPYIVRLVNEFCRTGFSLVLGNKMSYPKKALEIRKLCKWYLANYDENARLIEGPHFFKFHVTVSKSEDSTTSSEVFDFRMDLISDWIESGVFYIRRFVRLDEEGYPIISKEFALSLARNFWLEEKGYGNGMKVPGSKYVVTIIVEGPEGDRSKRSVFSYGDKGQSAKDVEAAWDAQMNETEPVETH
jgi:hypothetical protein